MEISLKELIEILYESYEEHKDWFNDYKEFIDSFTYEVKRLCIKYEVEYDEKEIYRYFKNTKNFRGYN